MELHFFVQRIGYYSLSCLPSLAHCATGRYVLDPPAPPSHRDILGPTLSIFFAQARI